MRIIVAAVAQMRHVRMWDMAREHGGRAATLGFCVLVARLDLLVEASRLLFVGKREAGHAFLELEGVEEGPVVIVPEALVELLVPDHILAGLWALLAS